VPGTEELDDVPLGRVAAQIFVRRISHAVAADNPRDAAISARRRDYRSGETDCRTGRAG
jgi:hypothetical protein